MEYQPRLDLSESRSIADALGLGLYDFLKKYADKRWPGSESFLLRKSRGACIFLKRMLDRKQAVCIIHPSRPSACRDWMPGMHQRECCEGLSKYWGLVVSASGEIMGNSRRIQQFRRFQESLMSDYGL